MLDGINIELGHGQSQYMNVFMQRLHEFRTAQAQVQDTLITFSSKCSYPDAYLGPDPGKPLSDALATELIDQVKFLGFLPILIIFQFLSPLKIVK